MRGDKSHMKREEHVTFCDSGGASGRRGPFRPNKLLSSGQLCNLTLFLRLQLTIDNIKRSFEPVMLFS